MSHDCRRSLCDTPHYDNDDHPEGCLCDTCHPEHTWETLGVYPDMCEGCEQQLIEWLKENVDYPICECGSFRIYNSDPDSPQCLPCYSAASDAIYESQKENLNVPHTRTA